MKANMLEHTAIKCKRIVWCCHGTAGSTTDLATLTYFAVSVRLESARCFHLRNLLLVFLKFLLQLQQSCKQTSNDSALRHKGCMLKSSCCQISSARSPTIPLLIPSLMPVEVLQLLDLLSATTIYLRTRTTPASNSSSQAEASRLRTGFLAARASATALGTPPTASPALFVVFRRPYMWSNQSEMVQQEVACRQHKSACGCPQQSSWQTTDAFGLVSDKHT